MSVKTGLCSYEKWAHCVELENGRVRLVASLDAGPRILHFGLSGGANELKLIERSAPSASTRVWKSMGGHRFWYTPERTPYIPDNGPVRWRVWGRDGVALIQDAEPGTGLQKSLCIRMHPKKAAITVAHRLRNLGRRTHRVGAWGLTVLKPGGEALLPLPPRGSFPRDLRAAGSLVLWPYTDLSNSAWRFGEKLLRFRPGRKNLRPQKIGLWSPEGWIAYFRRGRLLVIHSRPQTKKDYPDQFSNVETWGKSDMVEIETLGPQMELVPKASLEHVQHWSLQTAPLSMSDTALLSRVRKSL